MSRKLAFALSLFVLLSSLTYARFNPVNVKAPNGYPVHNIDTGFNYTTIQEAIDANETEDGHTIFVEEGMYLENIAVNKSLILIGKNRYGTVVDGMGSGNVVSILVNQVRITNFTIVGSAHLENGIFLDHVNSTYIGNNIIMNNDGYGIELQYSNNNTIVENDIIDNWAGIFLAHSVANKLEYNNVSHNDHGISVMYDSGTNTLVANTISHNGMGLRLYYSGGTTLIGNNITANNQNIDIAGMSLADFIQNIDTSNLVDAKPIYYLVDEKDIIIDPDTYPEIGYLALVDSTNITVRNITDYLQGLLLAYTASSLIENVETERYSEDGINLWYSNNNTLTNIGAFDIHSAICLHYSSNNNFTENNIAIHLSYSSNNNLTKNNIQHNFNGIHLVRSTYNIIMQNNIYDNYRGIHLEYSSDNKIYHNNFANNSQEAYSDLNFINIWDNGSEGNYWSDYNGIDSDGNGIGDTPYIINEDNQDNYPLVNPWAPSARAIIVDPFYNEIGPFKDLLYQVKYCLEDAGYIVSVIRNNNVTVEWLRDGLNQRVILWRGHSVQSPIGLITGEIVTAENTLEYEEDIENGRIGSVSKGDVDYWAIRPEFIEYYYTSNPLQYSLVVVEGCSSLSDISLASAFMSVAAGSYVGYITDVQEPLTSVDMRILFSNLCEKGYTVEEAVDSVFWGKHLLQYCGDPDLVLNANRDTAQSIAFIIQSPADLYITDPKGHHIGFDPVANQSLIEISDAMYTGPGTEPQVIWIPFALNGTYEILLKGTTTGEYNLTVGLSALSGTKTVLELGTITGNQTIFYWAYVSGIDIEVIPEFSSFLILPLFMIATLLTVIVYKTKHSIASKCEKLIE